jgi:V/A-type H+-transporting ATPase subunit A
MYSLSQIVVYIGCGERGNEIAEMLKEFPALKDPKTGRPIIERSIVIANTSNMPVSAREASIYMGITIAEYYRDQGYDVTLIADSTSRWAEAVREIAGRLGELPVERGYPAYLPDKIAEFYERGGRVKALGRPEREGSVTVLGAVSPPGGDFNEPVTIHTLRFVGTMWALDTDLAYRRHFPAVNWLRSFSQYADIVERWWVRNVAPDFPQYRRKALRLLTVASEIEAIASVVGESALPDDQRLILLASEIIKEGFLRQTALEGEDVFCKPEKQYWLLKMMIDFYDKAYELIKKRVSVEEIMRLPEIYEMMQVKEDERGLEAVKELYGRVMARLEEIAKRHGVTLESKAGVIVGA